MEQLKSLLPLVEDGGSLRSLLEEVCPRLCGCVFFRVGGGCGVFCVRIFRMLRAFCVVLLLVVQVLQRGCVLLLLSVAVV